MISQLITYTPSQAAAVEYFTKITRHVRELTNGKKGGFHVFPRRVLGYLCNPFNVTEQWLHLEIEFVLLFQHPRFAGGYLSSVLLDTVLDGVLTRFLALAI